MKQTKVLYFKEHQTPHQESEDEKILFQEVWELAQKENSEIKFLGNPNIDEEPAYLGINRSITASYYIGTCWLVENKIAAAVSPKIQELDYLSMLDAAFSIESSNEIAYFSSCYGIDFDKPLIKLNQEISNYLTPLLITQFLALVEKIVHKGLKKGYVCKEENLTSKVKGRISISKNIKENICKKRLYKNICIFQEFTPDIPENRLLKKALLFCKKILAHNKSLQAHSIGKKLQERLTRILTSFESVSDYIDTAEIKHFRTNTLFFHYNSALKLAKIILRRYDYAISNTVKSEQETRPYWIDMSRLYELYVYKTLIDRYGLDSIYFQVKGHGKTAVDFIKKDEQMIIDAKYKPRYRDSNANMLEDIRQISGYARDKKILKALGVNLDENTEIKCLIIYPEPQKLNSEVTEDNEENDEDCTTFESKNNQSIIEQAANITWFRNFYKIRIPLPTINPI